MLPLRTSTVLVKAKAFLSQAVIQSLVIGASGVVWGLGCAGHEMSGPDEPRSVCQVRMTSGNDQPTVSGMAHRP